MNLRDDETPQETPPPNAGLDDDAAHTTSRSHDALDDLLPVAPRRDFIQLLLQSPHRLYLYWTFARDPHATLREAFGALAADYRLMVRLVKVESGEEFLLNASHECMQWFEVFPCHVYRAEVGFSAPDHPFVRLLSSNTVTTPPDRASHLSGKEREFQLGARHFTQLLGSAGYERYARGLADDEACGGDNNKEQGGAASTAERQGAGERLSREASEEYPHR